jgi:Amino acid transporters
LPAPGDKAAIFSGAFAVALVYVMYSYSGWNASAYISSEIKRPEKNVPRSLLAGTSLVIVIYVLLNAIFLAATPAEELKGQLDVALIAGKHIFGENGGRFAGAIICLGLVAAISSMTWIGPRVTMSWAKIIGCCDGSAAKINMVSHKCHFPATALRESTSADSKLPGRGPLHAIQFAALLVACCAGRDRASFHASRNYATIPGLALPHSSCCFFDNHDLDDVLSIALAHCGIAGRFGNGAVGSAALFLRAKTP